MGGTAETDRVIAGAMAPGGLRSARGFRAPTPPVRWGGAASGLHASAARALDERRFFVLLPFALIVGLIVSATSPTSPEPWALLAVGAVVAAAIAVLWTALRALRILVLLAAFWSGFGLLTLHGALFGTGMLSRPAYGVYEARVDEILSETASGRRVILSDIHPVGTARALPMRRARIVIRAGPDLAPGDIIRLPIRFYPVPGPVVPGGFDTQFHSYFDGIGAYGNATGAAEVVTPGAATAPDHVVDAIRRAIASRIDAGLGQPSAGVARAIITGDQSAVTDAARETMATAGIAHVLSVSGLHLTIVAGGVFVALRMLLALFDALARRISTKRVAAGVGVVAALFYFSISGGNVAALRSTIMIVLVFGAVIFGRRALTMRNVAIAALAVIALDPASVFRPSFQLSFAAVTALVGTYEMLRGSHDRDQGLVSAIAGYFVGISLTSLVAGMATLLFSIYHFQQTSPLGVVGNLVTLPLVGFIMMPAAVLAVLAMPFGFEAPFLAAMGWSIDRMLDLAGFVAAWSGALTASPLLLPAALLFGLAALAWFAFFPDRYRLIGPIVLVPSVLFFAMDVRPDVLIADTTSAVALRTAAGLQLVAGEPTSFAAQVWRETYAEPIDAAPDGTIHCDSIACIVESPLGFRVSIVSDPAGFYEDCGWADLVVSRLAAPAECRAAVVIDADTLAAHGVHWLHWNAGRKRFEVRQAITGLHRPWRVARP